MPTIKASASTTRPKAPPPDGAGMGRPDTTIGRKLSGVGRSEPAGAAVLGQALAVGAAAGLNDA